MRPLSEAGSSKPLLVRNGVELGGIRNGVFEKV